ncbi:MAG TPA: molybdopterin-dependent oxidoreductase [Microlunatus sp.]|nr:molybdopterin-dependent oxidoreductase [Microlunatus sp.]
MTQLASDRGVPASAPEPTSAHGRGWAFVSGVLGGLSGVAVADLAAWFLAPTGAPVTAVGTLIINLLPGGLVNWGKETLGTADKPVLLATILLAVLALCGLAGVLELRRSTTGGLVFAGLAAIGLIAVLSGAQPSIRAIVPSLLGLLAGYLVLRALISLLRRWLPRYGYPGDLSALPSRRRFLGWATVVGVAAVIGTLTGRALTAAAGAVEDARAKFRLPDPVRTDPIPAEADLGIAGLSPYVTPNASFYRIDTALQVPTIDAVDWTLTITGMVEREVTISYADLIAKPLIEHVATLTCVSNEVGGNLIGNARWLGFPIRELLAEAGPAKSADMVLSTSEDGWTAGTPLSALTDPNRMALLAVGMNGEPLPIEHGYPVRMVVPGLYGYVSATKWVRKLEVTTFAADQGYWTPLGWSAKGPIKVSSRIDVPRKRKVAAGQVVIAGVAWDQHTGIEKVEVGIDGDWFDADLAAVTGADTWRQWRYSWDAEPGTHRIAVRATNKAGEVQTDAVAPPAPDGATGWHTITLTVA